MQLGRGQRSTRSHPVIGPTRTGLELTIGGLQSAPGSTARHLGSAGGIRRYRRGLVGTEKRERQKANRARRQAEQVRAARSDAVKRNALRWVAVVLAAVAGVVLIAWIGGAFDGGDDDDKAPSTSVPFTVPQISVATSVADTVPASTVAPTLPATDATTEPGSVAPSTTG